MALIEDNGSKLDYISGSGVNSVSNKFFYRNLKTKTKLHGLSPRANYTDRATALVREVIANYFLLHI
jgi:hypothetical protein